VKRGRRAGGFAVAHARRNCWCSVAQLDPAGDLDGDGRGKLGITWMDPFTGSRSRVDAVFGAPLARRRAHDGHERHGEGRGQRARHRLAVPFAASGDLDGDRRDDLLLASESKDPDENHHLGLRPIAAPAIAGPHTPAQLHALTRCRLWARGASSTSGCSSTRAPSIAPGPLVAVAAWRGRGRRGQRGAARADLVT
jgi:hypothetical protein